MLPPPARDRRCQLAAYRTVDIPLGHPPVAAYDAQTLSRDAQGTLIERLALEMASLQQTDKGREGNRWALFYLQRPDLVPFTPNHFEHALDFLPPQRFHPTDVGTHVCAHIAPAAVLDFTVHHTLDT